MIVRPTSSRFTSRLRVLAILSAAMLPLACQDATLPTESASHPTLRPRAEHYVCTPTGDATPTTPSDTVSTNADGSCPVGFDVSVWW